MTPPVIPPKGSDSKLSNMWLFAPALIVVAVYFMLRPGMLQTTGSAEEEYQSLFSRINVLEVQKLLAQSDAQKPNAVKIAEIDKQLATLKPRLAQLEPAHHEFLAEKQLNDEREAKRLAEETEQKKIRQAEKAAAEFQKRCDNVRAKRIADLTVNDLELLKECGTSVQGFPRVR